MPMFIDGIGASENIDSSGERIIIAGLDISSLDKDGIFNYEHKNDQPSQIVGKVLRAKKIFSDKDCDDERQKYYWDKVQVPYLYVMGELFDDYKDSAKDVAGMFRYDAAKKGQNERNVMNFSVEGAKISKEGMDITRSIARKITITVLPCNKMAIAEMVPSSDKQPKDDVDSIFKTESIIEVELLKPNDPMVLLEMLKKEDPTSHAKILGINPMKKVSIGGGLGAMGASSALSGVGPSSSGGVMGGEGMMRAEKKTSMNPNGRKIGSTSSKKDIMSHGRVAEYGFDSKEHQEAAQAHERAAQAAKDHRLQAHHHDKAKLHASASRTAQGAHRAKVTNKDVAMKPQGPQSVSGTSKVHDPALSGKVSYKKSEMSKAGMFSAGGERIPARELQQPNLRSDMKSAKKWKAGRSTKEAAGTSIGQGESVREGNIEEAKEAAGMALRHERRLKKPNLPKSEMAKALDAGSMNAAPGQLSGGAALGRENMSNKMQTTTMPKPPTIKPANIARPNKGFGAIISKSKSKWLKRAEEEYSKWPQKDKFEKFMAKRMPHLAKHEIQALGKALALSKSMKAEKTLAKIGGGAGDQPGMHSFVSKKEK